MLEIQIVKTDTGGANARLLAKEAKSDFRRVEAATIKIPTRFSSADGKRFFLRHFNSLQLNVHFISTIARTRLDHAVIEQAEMAIRTYIETATEKVNRAIDGADALFQAHGVSGAATYDTVPLELQVGVLSSTGRRFLELLVKLDQLMPLLQTLEIFEVITAQAVDIQRAALKREIREVAHSTRKLSLGLRRQMNALSQSEAWPQETQGSEADGAAPALAETDLDAGGDSEAGLHVASSKTYAQTEPA